MHYEENWVVIYWWKIILLIVMDFWNQKIWTSCLIGPSQNEKLYIDSHSKFVIGTQYMMQYKMINSYEESFISKP
jgi:hypothetical protein